MTPWLAFVLGFIAASALYVCLFVRLFAKAADHREQHGCEFCRWPN